MRSSVRHSVLGSTAIVIAVVSSIIMFQAGAQPDASQAGQTTGSTPNLNGIWQAVNTANWDLQEHAARPGPPQLGALLAAPAGLGVVEGNEIPYQPWAADKKKQNFEKRWTLDPEAKCYLPGVPRATYMPFPFQIVQGTDKIMIAYEYAAAVRVIHMDKVPKSPVDTWMGHSIGRWEGNTLVVDVTSFNGQAWLDRSGNFHSEALKVVERYTPDGPNVIQYEATLEDPKVFTRPWKISMPLYRRLEKNVQLLEFRCVEFSEELLYGHLRKKPSR
jgi:hypothetical protein